VTLPASSNADDPIARLTAALEATRDLVVRAEARLEQQREFLEKAQEVAHIGSWISELDGSEKMTWSPEMYRILGHQADHQPTRTRAIEDVHPDDREAVLAARQAAVAAGQPFEIEHRVITTSGAIRWVSTRANLVRDADGRPVRMVGTMQDITRNRELEEELRQSQKLEAIGRLAGGISHDLNNALTIIIGYADLAASALAEGDPVQQDVMEIQRAAERAESVTRQLLAFSRKQWLEPRVFQLSESVHDLGRMLERFMGPAVELTTAIDPDLPAIYGDRGQIEQAIVNLALNASDAMPNGGKITIRVTTVMLDAAFVQAHQPMEAGRYVELSVADTGHGMTPETRARIFDPFFTTKDVGRGTGLGLAMVYGTVKHCGGFIVVDSEAHKGSVFHLYFPATAHQTVAPVVARDPPAPAHGVTVLVVEDEPGVRSLAVTALSREGFRVLQADSGRAALAVAAQAGRIDVLLTDVTMPEMTGLELAACLCRTQEALRVIVMSALAENALSLPDLPRPAAFLPKPFTPNDLRRRMLDVLADTGNQLK
jgi:PAS domain S-box-containing protein